MPNTFSPTPRGNLFIASGMDPMMKWDGLRSQLETVGVLPPLTAITFTGYQPADVAPHTAAYWYQQYQIAVLALSAYSTASAGFGPFVDIRSVRKNFDDLNAKVIYNRTQYLNQLAKEQNGLSYVAFSGTYYAYMRFVDRDNNYSNLSPISAAVVCPTAGPITAVSGAVAPNQITSPAHGLATGDLLYISNVNGLSALNTDVPNDLPNSSSYPFLSGRLVITVVDADTFTINDSAVAALSILQTPGINGAQWIKPIYGFKYSDMPVSTEQKVVRRQILRNTAGQTRTFYVDVDTQDLISTVLTSTNSDTVLASSTPQVIIDDEGRSQLFAFSVPPNHKAVVVSQLGRMFAAVDQEYNEGSLALVHGSTTVTGIGTEWTSSLVNRVLYVVGGDKLYQITAVDTINQTLTLFLPYNGPTDLFANYAIRPPADEERLIYYTESTEEAWPPTNAIALQADGDRITGLMAVRSFLYVLEKRHIYRFSFETDPAIDGGMFLSTLRGCINQRCWVAVDDTVYLMDEAGIYSFGGAMEVQALSDSVHDLFESETAEDRRINWNVSRYFHAVNYPAAHQIRWFVALDGYYLPKHAIVHDYREKRTWLEELPFQVGCSVLGRMNDQPRIYLGAGKTRFLAYLVGQLDGPDPSAGTVRSTVTSATICSLTDTTASFASTGLVGNPVVIVAGRGKNQVRIISSVSGTTMQLTQPWLVLPDSTSKYQIGGIPFIYRTGRFRYVDWDETENARRVELVFWPNTAESTLDLRLFEDRNEDPIEMETDYTSNDLSGITATKGSGDLVVDLTKENGIVQKIMDGRREPRSDGPRHLAIELAGVSTEDGVTIQEIAIDGVKQ